MIITLAGAGLLVSMQAKEIRGNERCRNFCSHIAPNAEIVYGERVQEIRGHDLCLCVKNKGKTANTTLNIPPFKLTNHTYILLERHEQ